MNRARHRALLFDIDGTLLRAHGAGRRAMERAGRAVLGATFHLEGIDFAGRLNPHILDEAVQRCDLEIDDDRRQAFRRIYLSELEIELRRSTTEVALLPGVRRLLEALSLRRDVTLGLVTGNYEPSARLKVRAAGIDDELFVFGGFGDEAPRRPGLIPIAVKRAEEHVGRPVPLTDAVVIGDTPHDLRAAEEHGCRAVLVATGRHDVASLAVAGGKVVLRDLSHTAGVLEALLS